MRTSDFDYELPKELIAQYPAERRDESRLLVLGRADGSTEHRVFRDVIEHVRPNDVLVLNESAVIPARFIGRKRGSGGRVEMFLLRELSQGVWEALVRPGARIRDGAVLEFGGARGDGVGGAGVGGVAPAEGTSLTARVGRTLDDGKREVRLGVEGQDGDALPRALEELGRVPLPPYIDREPVAVDRERYQTVYARVPGAVAAPTAGLHFTDELMGRVEAAGGRFARIVLHVGLGTFRPVAAEDPSEHRMEEERFSVSDEAAGRINEARERGGRIVAVGTTSVRVLETIADETGRVEPRDGATRLFISPPHRFRAVDALITNFHLPRSTLLMLVSAFAGRERVLAAYCEAVRERYRFYSYGDAMLIA